MPESDAAALPTPAELDILAALWYLGPATVREVHDHLAKENGYTTTLKQMQLMVEKGLLTRGERFKSHVYAPVAAQEETQRAVAGDILRRLFGGSAKNLVLGALAAQPASPAELAEIRKLLGTVTQAATESSTGGDRGGGQRNAEGRLAAGKRIPPSLRSVVAEDGRSDAATRSRGGLERREASLSAKKKGRSR